MKFEYFFTSQLQDVHLDPELEIDFLDVYRHLLETKDNVCPEDVDEILNSTCDRLSMCNSLQGLIIKQFPSVGHFKLSPQQVEKFWLALQSCTSLNTFEIKKCALHSLTKPGRDLLFLTLSHLQNLNEIYIDDLYQLEQDDIECLGHNLMSLPSLKMLSISLFKSDFILDGAMDALCNILAKLDFKDLKITNLKLRELTIENWQKICIALSEGRTVKSLGIPSLKITEYVGNNWAEFVGAIANIRSLEELYLPDASLWALSADEWNIFGIALSKIRLKVLNLDANYLANLSHDDLSAFGMFISKLQFLKTISINKNYDETLHLYTDEGHEEQDESDEEESEPNNFPKLMLELTKCPSIENLSILENLDNLLEMDFNFLGDDLVEMVKLKSLTFDDLGLRFMRHRLASCFNLKHINFFCPTSTCYQYMVDFCNILATIPNLEKIEFGYGSCPDYLFLPATNQNFLAAFNRAPNLRYIRGLDMMTPERTQVLYGQPNGPLLLDVHPAHSQQTIYHARVIKAWYASIAEFLLRNGIHAGQNTILNSILEFWLPPNEKVLLDILQKGEENLMSFDEYDMCSVKTQVSYNLYEPLVFRVRTGAPSYLTTLKKSADIDLAAHLDELESLDVPADEATNTAVSPRPTY